MRRFECARDSLLQTVCRTQSAANCQSQKRAHSRDCESQRTFVLQRGRGSCVPNSLTARNWQLATGDWQSSAHNAHCAHIADCALASERPPDDP